MVLALFVLFRGAYILWRVHTQDNYRVKFLKCTKLVHIRHPIVAALHLDCAYSSSAISNAGRPRRHAPDAIHGRIGPEPHRGPYGAMLYHVDAVSMKGRMSRAPSPAPGSAACLRRAASGPTFAPRTRASSARAGNRPF